MSDAVADAPAEPEKRGKMPLLIGLVLAILGAGGGFYAVSSGLLSGSDDHATDAELNATAEALPNVSFVEVDPIMISLIGNQNVKHLRFRAQLEVDAAYQQDVTHVMPRVVDVLNGYLRALDLADLQDPMALIRLRSQMLRRVQMVVGKERVKDLLIMEFVLN